MKLRAILNPELPSTAPTKPSKLPGDIRFVIETEGRKQKMHVYNAPNNSTYLEYFAEAQERVTEIIDNLYPADRPLTKVYLTIKSKANE